MVRHTCCGVIRQLPHTATVLPCLGAIAEIHTTAQIVLPMEPWDRIVVGLPNEIPTFSICSCDRAIVTFCDTRNVVLCTKPPRTDSFRPSLDNLRAPSCT